MADLVMLDLEDGIPANEKQSAREGAIKAITDWGKLGGEASSHSLIGVRVNRPGSAEFSQDLESMRYASPDCIMIPKVESQDEMVLADQSIRESIGPVPIIATVETSRGVLDAPAIASSPRPPFALFLGIVDLISDLGATPSQSLSSLP